MTEPITQIREFGPEAVEMFLRIALASAEERANLYERLHRGAEAEIAQLEQELELTHAQLAEMKERVAWLAGG